jgi:hypothetical protein
VDKL